MEINTNGMKSIKEWARISGLKLYNYDGFVDIYSKLSGIESDDFYNYQIIRSRDCGDLLCTRKGFEAGLGECSMAMPEVSSYEKISNTLPDYIESNINLHISGTCRFIKRTDKGNIQSKDNIKKLLELLKLKKVVREKSIKINSITTKNSITKLKKEEFNPNQNTLIKIFNILRMNKATIEDLEDYLLNKIIKKLENLLRKKTPKLDDRIIDEINILTSILYTTARRESNRDRNIEEEFAFINLPPTDIEKPFVQEYSITGEGEQRKGRLFSYKPGNGPTIRGTIPISQDLNGPADKPPVPKK